MLPYVNIHTHRPTGSGIELRTAGVHPWDAATQDAATLGQRLGGAQAVGETGLDFVRGADRAAQLSALRTQLRLARERGLPVVLHCVRAFEPLMRELAASEPRAVIFHGFIGSPEQARQALAKGYCLSFGERTFASPKTLAALRGTPLSQLFLETDDSPVPIAEIYARAAEAKGVPEEVLQRAIITNEYSQAASTKDRAGRRATNDNDKWKRIRITGWKEPNCCSAAKNWSCCATPTCSWSGWAAWEPMPRR